MLSTTTRATSRPSSITGMLSETLPPPNCPVGVNVAPSGPPSPARNIVGRVTQKSPPCACPPPHSGGWLVPPLDDPPPDDQLGNAGIERIAPASPFPSLLNP